MSDLVFAIRFKADGTAEVVSSAKAVEASVASVGKAGRAAADEHATAQTRLNQIIAQTSTPVERLKAQLAELEHLLPFANTEQQIEALIRASDTLTGTLAEHSAGAQVAAAAQARLAQLIGQTAEPVERLKGQLAELEELRPFATTEAQAEALRRATASINAALTDHERVTSGAASAQARLAQIIAQTSTPMERLKAQFAELDSLKPFVETGEQAMALERALATVRMAMRAETDDAKAAAAAHAQIAAIMEQVRSPVEHLRGELARLEGLKPFASTTQDALFLERALARTRAAFAEAEEAADPLAVAAKRDAEALRGLMAQLNPAAVAAEKLAEAERLLGKALAGQVPGVTLSAEQHAALSRALREQHGVLDQTTGKAKLTSWQIWNLGQQAQDAAVQLVSGSSPFMVLAQQGPQAASAVGGFGNALRMLATPAAAGVAAVGALAVVMALAINRAHSIGDEVRGLAVSLKVMNPELDTTGERLRGLAARIAELRGVSRTEAMSAVRAAIGNDAVRDEATLVRIAGLAQDLAAVRGGAAAEWAQKLSEATAKGIAGLRALDDQINYLTPDEREQMAVMARHADQAGALALAMNALESRYGGAVKAMRSEGGMPSARSLALGTT